MKVPPTIPPRTAPAGPPPSRGASAAPKGPTFQAVLADPGGLSISAAQARGPRPARETGRRTDEAAEVPPPPCAGPAPPTWGALREPGAASFGTSPQGGPSSPPGASLAADPVALAAVAERVLRSLRIGTDGQGRSVVHLEVAAGPLAGCRVQLCRVAGGVAVEVRGEAGALDPRELEIVEALRRRGIEVA